MEAYILEAVEQHNQWHQYHSQKIQVQILTLPCTGCVILGQLLNISVPWHPHLYTTVDDEAGVKLSSWGALCS